MRTIKAFLLVLTLCLSAWGQVNNNNLSSGGSTTLPTASNPAQGLESPAAGTTYTAVDLSEVNAELYSGADICVKAAAACAANPQQTTILMTVNGTQACSVDPRGGWISGIYKTGNTGPACQDNLKIVGVQGTSPQLNIDVPWMIGAGPNTHNVYTNVGGVQIVASNNFRKNISGPRCYTSDASLVDTSGDTATCSNNISASNQIAISAQVSSGGLNGECSKVTLTTSVGGANIGDKGGKGDAQVFRGGQIVNFFNFADARNNGPFRIVPAGDTNACGGTLPNNGEGDPGGDYSIFWIKNSDGVSCTAGNCGAHLIVVAESPMFYFHMRYWDQPTNNASTFTQQSCLNIDGTEDDGKCISQGVKLVDFGEVDGFGYGLVGGDNMFGQEQVGAQSIQSRGQMRTSMMSWGYALSGNGSQNNAGFKGWEDYCASPFDNPPDCYSDGTHTPFGLFHVGVWLRDGWSRVAVDDVTFNSSAYAGIMIDSQAGFTGQTLIQHLHFQNTPTNQISGGSVSGSTPNLCNIAIGFQSAASGTTIIESQSDGTSGILENICIGGTNHVPTSNMPNWSTGYMPAMGKFIPTSNNPGTGVCGGSQCIIELVAPFIGATLSDQPNWSTCNSNAMQTVGGQCTDATDSVTYENIGGHFPNDVGPSNSNQVKIVSTLEGGNGSTGNIFNGATLLTWSDADIADYEYQKDSSNVTEWSTSSEHASQKDSGINTAGASVFSGGINISGGTFLCTTSGCPVISSSLQNALAYYSAVGTANTISGALGPSTLNGVPQFWTSTASGGAAGVPTPLPAGVPTNAQTGTTYTIALTDRASYVSFSNASAIAVTLPYLVTTPGFANNFTFVACDIGAGSATLTPTTSTISYTTGSTYVTAPLVLKTGQCAFVYSDNTNYFAIYLSGGSSSFAESSLTGSTAATTITEAAAGDAITRAGVETSAPTAPCVFKNPTIEHNFHWLRYHHSGVIDRADDAECQWRGHGRRLDRLGNWRGVAWQWSVVSTDHRREGRHYRCLYGIEFHYQRNDGRLHDFRKARLRRQSHLAIRQRQFVFKRRPL